jgi:DNA repair exonuclease SbcCD ATPase subunit
LNVQQKEQVTIEGKCAENDYLLSKIRTRYKKEEKSLKETIDEINKKIDKKIDEKADVISVLTTELVDITLQVEKLSAPLKKKDEVLQISEQKLDNLKILYDYLISKDRQKLLMELQNKKELKNAAKIIAELSEFQEIFKTIIRCIQEVQVDSASTMISKASKRINEIYNEIVHHPYYTELTIEVQPSLRRGTAKNNYFIKGLNRTDGLETLAGERFSTGHMNCVALAIYLAMSETKILNHKLNFLILDDPSQNLDENHMQSLAKILNNISNQSQLIISTQDPAFTPILSAYLKDPSIIKLKFDKWDCKTGPSFQYVDKI